MISECRVLCIYLSLPVVIISLILSIRMYLYIHHTHTHPHIHTHREKRISSKLLNIILSFLRDMLCLIGAWVSETFDCVSDPWACYVSAHFIRELKAPTMGRTLWVRRLNREIIVFNSKELDRLVLACILLVGFLLVKLCVFGEYNYDTYIYTHTYIHMYINIYNI